MDKLGKILFLHFEKVLVGVFGLALLYSVVFYGPWAGRQDFNETLQAIAKSIAEKPQIDVSQIPEFPDLPGEVAAEKLPAQRPVSLENIIWKLVPKPDNMAILPPTDVAAVGGKGYIAVTWQINPNQTSDTLATPIGVQVERATLGADGLGPFENLTAKADGEYFVPGDLYKLAMKYVPQLIASPEEETPDAKTKGPTKPKAPYTADDLYNALHDGLITENDVTRLIRTAVLKGWMTSQDQAANAEMLRDVHAAMRDLKRDDRFEGRPARSQPELFKAALEMMGYNGGGNYKPNTTVVTAVAATTGAPGGSKPTVTPVAVGFEDVKAFVDADVNSDQEYVYRVRFWAADTTQGGKDKSSSSWAPVTTQTSSKPDTEFYLSGVSREQGFASILVRKWLPASNGWASKTYQVAPGEEIGHMELVPKTDASGAPVVAENGKREMLEVDFSTDCVLLDFGYRPRSFEKPTKITSIDPLTQEKSVVDTIERLLYDTPQIVYSDRKGRLKVRWRTLANVS